MVLTSTSLTNIIEEFNVTFIDIFIEVSNEICLLAIPITEVIECGMDLQSTETEHQYDETNSEIELTQVATNASMAAGISGSTAAGPSSIIETKRSLCFSANEPRDPLKNASRRIEMTAGCLKGLVRTIRPVS